MAAILGALWLPACGGDDGACVSPTQNLEKAYETGATGCACNPATDKPICVKDATGRNVALICDSSRWIAVEDGPCAPGS